MWLAYLIFSKTSDLEILPCESEKANRELIACISMWFNY